MLLDLTEFSKTVVRSSKSLVTLLQHLKMLPIVITLMKHLSMVKKLINLLNCLEPKEPIS